MNSTPNHRRAIAYAVTLACAAMAAAHTAHAEDAAELPKITVEAQAPAVPRNLPASTEGVTAKQIAETSNTVTSAETIQYLPSVHVRQRYIGDRNSIIAMRTNSSISSAQTILYADNLLLSNYTDNSFRTPPRWGMVSPEEIDRVDVIYGPFSALYPGNSMSGIVIMSTRMPTQFEAHVKADAFTQHFKLYNTENGYSGTHASASAGNKFGDWSIWVSGDHLDSHGQPQTFGAATRPTTSQPASNTPFTQISGGYRDIDTSGRPRIVTSSIGADHTVQDVGKFKLAYDFGGGVRATYTLGYWRNDADTEVQSYVTNAAGTPVYNTTTTGAQSGPTAASTRYVKFAGDSTYYVLSGVNPVHVESEHWMHGLSLKSSGQGDWRWEGVATYYDQAREQTRTASNNTTLFDSGTGTTRPGGTLAISDGTGWTTLDLRGEWAPAGQAHALSFGYHFDHYELSLFTYRVSDWLTGSGGTKTSSSLGKTETQAIYVQDAWRLASDWRLVVGGRAEWWRAFDGSNFNSTNVAPTPLNLVYANRSQFAFSPKASLSFQATPDWNLRVAYGKAYRFPTVSELFQEIDFGNNFKLNDPSLKPEHVHAGEFAVERGLPGGLWRTSLFWEDKRDGLISQTDTTVTPNVSSVQNVDRIRTRGIETALLATDLLVRGFDLSGSITYLDSKILTNHRNPAVEGRDQPRLPNWRATMVATYRASDALSGSVAVRYSGQQHNSLLYNDVNPNVYGAVSSYTVIDTKLAYKFAPHWTGSLGVNNLGNYKYYVNPNPYPQRTYFASLKYDI